MYSKGSTICRPCLLFINTELRELQRFLKKLLFIGNLCWLARGHAP